MGIEWGYIFVARLENTKFLWKKPSAKYHKCKHHIHQGQFIALPQVGTLLPILKNTILVAVAMINSCSHTI